MQDKLPKDIINLIESYLPSEYVKMMHEAHSTLLKIAFGKLNELFYVTIPIKYVSYDWNLLWNNKCNNLYPSLCNVIPNEIDIGNRFNGSRHVVMSYTCPKCHKYILYQVYIHHKYHKNLQCVYSIAFNMHDGSQELIII